MGYKQQNWMQYGRQGEIVEIIMRDSTNAKLESFKCNNNKSYNRALSTIAQKYGEKFKPTIGVKHSASYDDELGWLKKEKIL